MAKARHTFHTSSNTSCMVSPADASRFMSTMLATRTRSFLSRLYKRARSNDILIRFFAKSTSFLMENIFFNPLMGFILLNFGRKALKAMLKWVWVPWDKIPSAMDASKRGREHFSTA